MVQPLVTRLVLGGDGHGTALLRSAATTTRREQRRRSRAAAPPTSVPTTGAACWSGTQRVAARSVPVTVVPGGFTLVRR